MMFHCTIFKVDKFFVLIHYAAKPQLHNMVHFGLHSLVKEILHSETDRSVILTIKVHNLNLNQL